MTTDRGHPTRDELLAMAWVDDELAADARREFERRLAAEPALGRLVVAYQRLEVVARHAAPAEPMDHEWQRLARDPVQRTGASLGWGLVALGSVGLSAWIGWELVRSDLEPLPKALLGALVLGFLLLFLVTLRGRLRTLAYDPYLEVER